MDEASIFEFENNQIEKGFTNNIILEHLVEYLLNYYSLPINKLNIHLNFGNYDYKVPTNIIANYQRVITAIKKLQNLLYNHNFLKEDLNEIGVWKAARKKHIPKL